MDSKERKSQILQGILRKLAFYHWNRLPTFWFVGRPIWVPLPLGSQRASWTLAFYNLGQIRCLRLVVEQDFVIWGLEDPVLEFVN